MKKEGKKDISFKDIRKFYDENLHPNIINFDDQNVWENVFHKAGKKMPGKQQKILNPLSLLNFFYAIKIDNDTTLTALLFEKSDVKAVDDASLELIPIGKGTR